MYNFEKNDVKYLTFSKFKNQNRALWFAMHNGDDSFTKFNLILGLNLAFSLVSPGTKLAG